MRRRHLLTASLALPLASLAAPKAWAAYPERPDHHDRRLPAGRRHRRRRAHAGAVHANDAGAAYRGEQPRGRGRRARLLRARPGAARRLHDRLHQHAQRRHHPDRAPRALPPRGLLAGRQRRRRSGRVLRPRRQPVPHAGRPRRARQGQARGRDLRHQRHRLGRPPRRAGLRAAGRRQVHPRPLRRRVRRAQRAAGASRSPSPP